MGLLTEGHWGVNRHCVLINTPLIAYSAPHYPACLSSVSLESVLSGETERKHNVHTQQAHYHTQSQRNTDYSSLGAAAELCLLCWYDKVTPKKKNRFMEKI